MTSHLLLLLFIPEAWASVLRVETGHQPIAIEGRDLYMGYFTKVHFDSLTCIGGLLVHCLRPLTGAEEIDLLYSACPKGHWRVAHYMNTKEEFRLKAEVTAKQLLIASREPLTIIDVQVISCRIASQHNISCHDVREHPHRHTHPDTLRAHDSSHIRRKRAVTSANALDFEAMSQIEIDSDRTVPRGSTMTVEHGSVVKFGDGVKLIIQGSLVVKGSKEAPVRFEALNNGWAGVLIENGSPVSSLRYLNISGAQGAGITVIGGHPPTIENVISDSNGHGFRIESNSSEIRVVKSLALNNRGAGFIFSGKAPIIIDSCSTAANRGNGIQVQSSAKLKILQSSIYSNSHLGVLTEDVSDISCEENVVSGNGAGFRIARKLDGKSKITFDHVNISGHHYGPAILLDDDLDTHFKLVESQLHDNYQGGLKSVGHFEGTMEITGTNFTRNRGSTLLIDTLQKGMILVEKCIFHQNQLNDYKPSEAVLQINTESEEDGDAVALITDCEFSKNIMNDVIIIKKVLGHPKIAFESNDIRGNLARNVLSYDDEGVTVKSNFFNNPQSSCEVMTSSPSSFDSGQNYYGYALQSEIRERICSRSSLEIVTARNVDDTYDTNPSIVNNPLPKIKGAYTTVKALPTPYTIDEDIIIAPNQTLVVEPGTQLIFGPNVGITVQERGKLVLNGTQEAPITMFSTGRGAWRGLTVKPGGSLFLNTTTLTDPSIGVWLDSERFYLENVVVKRPNVHGVEVTMNAGSHIDLGGTVIQESIGTALAVDETKQNITLTDFRIEDSRISGIDFAAPSGAITIENAIISNSGSHGIHISEYPHAQLNSISLRNVTLKDQKTGHAGLLISGGWINEINIEQLHAEGNVVPSIMLVLECNDKPSMTRIYDSIFVDNRDTVLSLQLEECGGLQLERNLFDRNNADGRAGVVRIDAEPNPGLDNLPIEITNNDFSANGGDFVMFLSTDGDNKIDGKVTRNRLHDNAVSQAGIIVASPYFYVQGNRFENPKTKYQVEPRGDGSWILNATNNWWGTEDPAKILETVKATEGSVILKPFIVTGDIASEIEGSVTTVSTTAVSVDRFQNCSHLNFCSRRGNCLGNLCFCPAGFGNFDCSIQIGCTNGCSKNGICNVLNVCHCFEGWTGQDCSTPMCSFDCGGHGKCVSKDECECQEDWTGEFCLEAACTSATCINGNCTGKQCVCEGPWKGKRCDVPVCNSCSLNGVCTEPEKCRCFADWGGEGCSQCVGPSCNSCDLDCDHGTCDEVTRTCACAKGWSGAACDLCETSGGCSTTGRISTIQPQTADREDTNTVITVFGKELPKTINSHYSCVFGMLTTIGIRQSSSIIRCPMPGNLTAGRHLFNIAAGPNVLSTLESKPVHFTVYDACNPAICQGSCIGPLCICPRGKAGIQCEIIEQVPEIEKHFLTNQQVNSAVEGTPYVVRLPTMPGTVLRVNSSISDLRLDSARSILEWPDPIGQTEPHDIVVTAYSLAGESMLAWNVTVNPSYTAFLDDVSTQGNKLLFKGKVQGDQTKQMPVSIRVRSADGSRIEELTTKTDTNGSFAYAYIPVEPGKYFVSATHPGQESNDVKEIDIIAEAPPVVKESGDRVNIYVTGEDSCQTSTLPKKAGEVTSIVGEKAVDVSVKPFVSDEFFVLIQCQNGKELIKIGSVEGHEKVARSYPERFILSQNTTSALSEPLEIFFTPGSEKLHKEVQLHSARALHVISTFPRLDDYAAIALKGLTIVFQLDVSTVDNGTLIVTSNKEELISIPYSVLNRQAQTVSSVLVCLRDEFYGLPKPDSKIVASLSITNPQLKVDKVEYNVVVNGEAAVFLNLPEGYYQLTVLSQIHDPVSQFVQISPHNNSFCLDLKSTSPISSSLKSGNWSNTMISKPNGRLPYLELSPSVVVDRATTDVLITVKGDVIGVVSVENSDYFHSKVQSVQYNDSFWGTLSPRISDSVAERCTAVLLPINFDFLADGAELPIRSFTNIIVRRNLVAEKQLLCDEFGKAFPNGVTTKILCNCGDDAKTRCRAKYRAATACGSSWSRIADDTVSLHVLSTFLLLIGECEDVQVDFDELADVLRCVSALEAECPIVNTRLKRDLPDYPLPPDLAVEQMQNDGPASIINQLSSIQSINIPMQPSLLKFLNAIDMQSYKVSLLYQDFFTALKKVFPVEIPSRDEMQTFIAAIGEKSQNGMEISEGEMEKIKSKDLAILWNDTVNVWTSGKMNSTTEIQYEDAKVLVGAADKLKSFARQNGATDPFAVLHEYLGKLLQTTSAASQECAQATVLIEPKTVYDGDTMDIRVYLTNTKEQPMNDVNLDFEVLRADSLAPEAVIVSNGIAVNTNAGVLSPGESLETKWQKRIVPQKTITAVVKYKPVITLSFSVGGKETKQRLEVTIVELHPARSAKIVHFIYPSLTKEHPFSVATSIMNTGYSLLERVKVHSFEVLVGNDGTLVPYTLDVVSVDGQEIDTALTFNLGHIESGESKMISVVLKTDVPTAKILSAKCPISVDGQMISVQEENTYTVVATAGSNGLMVKNEIGASFFFRPDTGNLANIVPLTFVANRSTSLSSPDRKVVLATFKNEESRSFTGFLWGSTPYPDIPDDYELVKVTEKANGKRDRQVRPITWKDGDRHYAKQHFVDSSSTSSSYTMTYEFVFANPHEYSVPRFEQAAYRIQLVPDIWWPQPPNMIGQVAAENEDGVKIEYSLYSPDNSRRFSVDQSTGSIIVEEPVEAGKEYCLVMAARDERGQESRVPVAINTGGTRQDCYLFDIEGLFPMVSHWDVLPTVQPTSSGLFTVSTLPTHEPPTESPSTDEIDVPTPPVFTPITEKTEGTAATRTVPTDSSVTDTDPTPEPSTEPSESTESTWATYESTQQSEEPATQTTELVTPDHTLVTVTTEATDSTITSETTETHPSDTSTPGTATTSEVVTEVTEPSEETVYTVTPDRTPATIATQTGASVTVSVSTEITDTVGTMGTAVTVTWGPTSETASSGAVTTETIVTGSSQPVTDSTSNVTSTPEGSLPTASPTGVTITVDEGSTVTVERPVTVVTANTVGGSTVTAVTVPTTTDQYSDACNKVGIPVWNLICELSKTVVRRGG